MTDQLVARLTPHAYREVARHLIDTPTYEWIRSGSGEDFDGDNEGAFARRRLRPSVLVDVSAVNTATTVLGAQIAAPVIIGPMGLQRAAHPDGELAMAAGAAAAGSLFTVAVNATTSIEDIAARAPGLPLWFQLYNWDDRDALAAVIARVEAAGVPRDRAPRQHADRRESHLAAARIPAAGRCPNSRTSRPPRG